MDRQSANTPISQNAVMLTAENTAELTKGLPRTARMALSVMAKIPHGTLTIQAPDGRILKVGGNAPGPDATLILNNWNLPRRAMMEGTIGVGESYIDGDWESPDVTTFLELFLVNNDAGEQLASGTNWLLSTLHRMRHWMNRNTRTGSKRNISAHYDLGNAFYKQWLDRTMTYSSALFGGGANDLASAQIAKYRALAEATGIKPGDHVLEIGCGWGGFAEFAAGEMGCRVTGLTISDEQLKFARERMEKAGLSDRVDIRFQDYRDETGVYDRITSIEMFEAVGEKYWPIFFGKVKDCLKPGGTAGLQIITIKDEAFPEYSKNPDFIQRYVFPGGMLPSPSILRSLGSDVGLAPIREHAFPQDYARTLAEWRQRFLGSWENISMLGFGDQFRRLWEFYLHYCEAGFRTEYIDVRQVVYKA